MPRASQVQLDPKDLEALEAQWVALDRWVAQGQQGRLVELGRQEILDKSEHPETKELMEFKDHKELLVHKVTEDLLVILALRVA